MGNKLSRAIALTAALLLAGCLLSGCTALLERSYSSVEPYADRYWDPGAEDTLRVESYQDLVNSLLLLIEERAEEGSIRCYGEVGQFQQFMAARKEVRQETTLGAYVLKELRFTYEEGAAYSTVACYMTYREDAEDVDSIMILSDSQSLVDLLRLTVREERDKLTARFSYDMPRSDVTAAVESFWQELCLAEMEEELAEETAIAVLGQAEAPPESGEEAPPEETEPPEELPEEGEPPADLEPDGEVPVEVWEETAPEEEPVIEYPPCPWKVKFYPDKETAEIVEVLLLS